ncbi:hypothetical protein [Rahnella sp. WP5]|nr:hypothetical protein [Rahnella sp. WP5]
MQRDQDDADTFPVTFTGDALHELHVMAVSKNITQRVIEDNANRIRPAGT